MHTKLVIISAWSTDLNLILSLGGCLHCSSSYAMLMFLRYLLRVHLYPALKWHGREDVHPFWSITANALRILNSILSLTETVKLLATVLCSSLCSYAPADNLIHLMISINILLWCSLLWIFYRRSKMTKKSINQQECFAIEFD